MPEENFSQLGHPGLEKLIKLGIKKVSPQKVVLFGSRARKTNREASDFDIAFFFEKSFNDAWTKFLFEIEDSPSVLFKVDWVNANEAQTELLAKINQDGIVLYEAG